MQQKVLFITWDGPQTNYMEGLFLPIFNEIGKKQAVDFHVIQFTWADAAKNEKVSQLAKAFNIKYTSIKVHRKPSSALGSICTLFKGIKFLDDYIKKNGISIVMPRSTMPAVMVNRLRYKNVKILFDADGLSLEERIDFAGLSPKSKQYLWLKREETKLLFKADAVITRSQKAIEIHRKTIDEKYNDKFSVVFNGRDTSFFEPNESLRLSVRQGLGLDPSDFVFVYCGSLGPQYGWEEMITVFEKRYLNDPKTKFLILSGNPEYALQRIPAKLKEAVIVKSIPFDEVPKYLNVADCAFAIRKPTFSMQGVAPIKLGEYLLMGLPTIASKGIGDTDLILEKVPHCFLFDHCDASTIDLAVSFSSEIKNYSSKEEIRNAALHYFSLEKSAESYQTALQKI
ncbi:hypothetical protein FEDK69T_21350 [Flavobacterium enshiense DK69]|uniref:Glycosyltransferase subfamily 4-like N-terminal domain-containing protein n=1 Tax=Flavobacterium enshiense DK69 TaxID=1107311 RepID=V6S6Z7_9FLAO|nr:glycosyltransferase [Flavobacterium enshiense]ESU22159.1 hypothetical protein FEDK69T_21350 [Flavobacterium enshiense DK69]KGO97169.1 hypothetical protein Q767_00765 [Flavobacterium enshiense DK69]